MRFKGRLSRFNPDDPQYDVLTFLAGKDDASRAQVRALSYSEGRSHIINQYLCTPRGIRDDHIVDQIYIDQTSVDQHGPHPDSAENLQTETGFLGNPNRTAREECFLFAKYYVENYKQPRARVDRLVFKSLRSGDYRAEANWDLLTNVDISHLIDLNLSAPGTAFNESYFVEGIRYEIDPARQEFADVELSLDVSPQAYYETDPF